MREAAEPAVARSSAAQDITRGVQRFHFTGFHPQPPELASDRLPLTIEPRTRKPWAIVAEFHRFYRTVARLERLSELRRTRRRAAVSRFEELAVRASAASGIQRFVARQTVTEIRAGLGAIDSDAQNLAFADVSGILQIVVQNQITRRAAESWDATRRPAR
jgi:hypothetical protein